MYNSRLPVLRSVCICTYRYCTCIYTIHNTVYSMCVCMHYYLLCCIHAVHTYISKRLFSLRCINKYMYHIQYIVHTYSMIFTYSICIQYVHTYLCIWFNSMMHMYIMYVSCTVHITYIHTVLYVLYIHKI
jgi:hypothetical protein